MNFKLLVTLLLAGFMLNLSAQTTSKDVLFTVEGDPIYASEFLRVYNKNLDLVQDESQKNVDEYLKLFTNYKLKIKEATALGLNEKPTYLKELATYKKQLTKNYITDSKVTDKLVNEAYQRTVYEIDADHILIRMEENTSPADTLIAYNKLVKLRERALKEGFEKVRAEVHNGETIYGEKLGYFSGFKMVYAFESIAYNTDVEDISKPFRTRFGYHIIKINDKRKSRGERTVAHIMLVDKKEDNAAEKPEVRIREIYSKLKQGEAFESLAKQFSDDKNSAPKGGELAPFSSGEIRAMEFETTAFNLENINDVSEPFKTDYGWHIVKLLDKKLIPEFKVLKSELIEKVKRDERSKLIDEALINTLKTKYTVNKTAPNLNYFVGVLNQGYYNGTWTLPENFKGKEAFIKIGNKQFSNNDFAVYLKNSMRNTKREETIESLVANKYDSFLSESLIKYQEDNLEFENEDYANIVSEYRDGLLLFDLMESTIWNTAQSDSTEIAEFYNQNKSNYKKLTRIDAVVASSGKQKTLRKVSKLLKKGMEIENIKALVNSNDNINVIFTTGVMDTSHQALPKSFKFEKGVSKIRKHNDAFVVVQVNEILPEEQKTLKEAKGNVISDYQNKKEENWISGLAKKYEIKLNQDVLQKVKKQLKK